MGIRARIGEWLEGRTSAAVSRLDFGGRLARIERRLDDLEYFSHGMRATYIGNNRMLVRAVIARNNFVFLLEADDKLITPWFAATGMYETPLTDFFLRELKPDSRCLDLGANFGYFTCLMARFCPKGQVIGVEADDRIQAIARDNLAINGLDGSGKSLHAAVSDSAEPLILYRRHNRSANTSIVHYDDTFLAESHNEPPSERIEVPGIRIDDLADRLGGRVDFIKIDVEGAEPLAFAGAEQTIAANPQLTIVMEWSPGQIDTAGTPPAAFVGRLEAMGLSSFSIVEGGVAPLATADLLALPYAAGIVLRRA